MKILLNKLNSETKGRLYIVLMTTMIFFFLSANNTYAAMEKDFQGASNSENTLAFLDEHNFSDITNPWQRKLTGNIGIRAFINELHYFKNYFSSATKRLLKPSPLKIAGGIGSPYKNAGYGPYFAFEYKNATNVLTDYRYITPLIRDLTPDTITNTMFSHLYETPEIGFNSYIPSATAVPLPGTLILLASSIIGLSGLKKIRKETVRK